MGNYGYLFFGRGISVDRIQEVEASFKMRKFHFLTCRSFKEINECTVFKLDKVIFLCKFSSSLCITTNCGIWKSIEYKKYKLTNRKRPHFLKIKQYFRNTFRDYIFLVRIIQKINFEIMKQKYHSESQQIFSTIIIIINSLDSLTVLEYC